METELEEYAERGLVPATITDQQAIDFMQVCIAGGDIIAWREANGFEQIDVSFPDDRPLLKCWKRIEG